MIRVLTPPRTTALVALDTVKALLEIAGSEQDALLSHWIAIASSLCTERLTFELGRAAVRELLIGHGRTRMYLGYAPVEPESLTVSISGTAVTDWTLEDPVNGLLYRAIGWDRGIAGAIGEDREANITAEYRGGYLLPDDVTDWAAMEDYSAGQFVRSSTPSVLRFECTTAGTSGATEPAWPATAGATVTDGAAVWTAHTAWELPPIISDCAYGLVVARKTTAALPAGISSLTGPDGDQISFFAAQTEGGIPSNIQDALDQFRLGRGGMA